MEQIYKHKQPANFQTLRDKLVTADTKKNHEEYKEISNNIKELNKKKNELVKILSDFCNEKKNIKMTLSAHKKLCHDISKIKEEIKTKNIKLRETAKGLPYEKNEGIYDWELETPKDIRAGAVNDVCNAIKSGISNLKAGNIRHFRLGFRVRTDNYKSMVIPKKFLCNKDGTIHLAPQFLKNNCKFKMGKKTIKKHRKLEISHDCRIVKRMDKYWLLVPIPMECKEKTTPVNYCGIDPGVRTFMTAFGNTGCMEYQQKDSVINKIDAKIRMYKDKRIKKQSRVYKKKLVKLERRKENVLNDLHWKTITNIVRNNDFIFYGDIKSHDIVKGGKNRKLNGDTNNLKFYVFKQRLLHKANECGKKVFVINESYTTQTCSFCGNMYKGEKSKVYSCNNCNRKIGRDVNAAKNILIKGIQCHLCK